MSSVKDRIRDLQQSAPVQPSQSVSARAKAVERASEAADDERSQTLSKLTKQFDSNAPREGSAGLGARVARFDSDASESLKERITRLESGASDTGSLAGRAAAYERTGDSVKGVAGRFVEEKETPGQNNASLHRARAVFEARDSDRSVEQLAADLKKPQLEDASNAPADPIPNPLRSVSRQETSAAPPPLPPTEANASEAVSRRAAMFERTSSDSQNKSKAPPPTQRDPPIPQPVASQMEKQTQVTAKPKPDIGDEPTENDLKDELRDVKRVNEELVSTLLELTAAFKRLEGVREDLQKRISELENK